MKLRDDKQENSSNVYELLKSFVCVSIHWREEAEKRLKLGKPTNTYGINRPLTPLITESEFIYPFFVTSSVLTSGFIKVGHLHWDKIDDLEKDMRVKGFGRDSNGEYPIREPVIEAWAMMFFRKLLFHRTALLPTKGTLMPEFYNSKVPVYIG